MKADHLTKAQAQAIHQRLQPMVGYLLKLQERMEERGFDRDDKRYAMVNRAYDSAYALFIELHYLSCDGVGRPPRGR